MEAKVFNTKGKEVSKIELSEALFGQTWNADLVHQVVTSTLSTRRDNIAHTKTRGEVAGGGKKPWKQKGTGRARHGSNRSPIWVGGGVAHGPRNDKNYNRKVNKKAANKALRVVLSEKFRDGEIIFVDSLSFEKPETKKAKDILASLSKVKGFEVLETKVKNALYLTTAEKSKAVEGSFRNVPSVTVAELRNLNVSDLLKAKFLLIEAPETSLKALETRLTK
jgi:large subunit ribosomal protein L4